MKSPALAIGWQLWSRNRIGLACVALWIPGLALALLLLPPEHRTGTIGLLARMSLVPAFFYAMTVFTFADLKITGNVRFERYPGRMFTLPVRTSALVGWPMLYGGVGIMLLWLVAERLILRQTGVAAPILAPAMGLALMTAFFQALAWAPFASPLPRVLGTSFIAPAPILLVLRASIVQDWNGAALAPLFGLLLALAYAGACLGVARDRRGDTLALGRSALDWLSQWRSRRGQEFGSAASAQAWHEWRTKGLLLPAITGLTLLLIGLPLGLMMPEQALRSKTVAMLGAALALSFPVWMCVMIGAAHAKPRLWSGGYGLPSFLAVRPMLTGHLYTATLRAQALSLAATWALMAPVLVGLWLAGADAGAGAAQLWGLLAQGHGSLACAGLGLLLAAAAYALGMGLLAGGLTAGLTGRQWIINGDGLLRTAQIALVMLAGRWLVHRPDMVRELLGWLPWLAGAGLAAKAIAAGLALRATLGRRLIRTATVLKLLALWTLGAACLAGLAYALTPAASPVSPCTAAMWMVYLLPLVRPALGPLALDWNRHR